MQTSQVTQSAQVSGGYMQVAGLFGESDEEKAAREAAEKRENDQDAAITDLRQRVQDLESALQQTTGQSESQQHRIRVLEAQISRMQKDWNYKLCTLTAQLMGVDTTNTGLSCDGSKPVVTAEDAPPSAAEGDYDKALKELAHGKYDAAQADFQAFADANVKDALAPKALYWVGKIAFLKQDFPAAAKAFAENLKRYSKNDIAPASMVSLGHALISMGQKHQGCLTLRAVPGKYRKADSTVLKQAKELSASLCK